MITIAAPKPVMHPWFSQRQRGLKRDLCAGANVGLGTSTFRSSSRHSWLSLAVKCGATAQPAGLSLVTPAVALV